MDRTDIIRKICVILFVTTGILCLFFYKGENYQVYKGYSEGYDGMIEVEVTVWHNRKGEVRVKDVKYTHEDTPELANPVFDNIIGQLKSKQDVKKLDIVAGATYTSTGCIEALKCAVESAK